MKEHYRCIKETFKYYSGISPMGRTTCVGQTVMTEIVNQCPGLVDGKFVQIKEVDLAVIACNGGRPGNNYLSPTNALVRFQMIEVLARLARDRYCN